MSRRSEDPMSDRKQRILSAMNTRKKRVRQLAREHREEAERARGQAMAPRSEGAGQQAPAAAPAE